MKTVMDPTSLPFVIRQNGAYDWWNIERSSLHSEDFHRGEGYAVTAVRMIRDRKCSNVLPQILAAIGASAHPRCNVAAGFLYLIGQVVTCGADNALAEYEQYRPCIERLLREQAEERSAAARKAAIARWDRARTGAAPAIAAE